MNTLILGIPIIVFLAYANGANDNFKGVATLFGSGTTDFKKALAWATLTTGLGSLAALIFAQGLLTTFSGKGLVPDAVVGMKSFSLAVGLAAASTVMLATKFGFPISTTHALTGALVGCGLFASTAGVNFSKLGSAFFLPLLLSPVISITLAMVVYPLFKFSRKKLGVERETCVCIGTQILGVVPAGMSKDKAIAMYASTAAAPSIQVGTQASCIERYQGDVFGLSAGSVLDKFHYISAGVVGFARGLNDTPKIAAILLAGAVLPTWLSIVLVSIAMAIGGLLNSKKVAETMSLKVTGMNPGQGFTANLVTGFLVIFASKLGMPVSTTHVSCGSLFGIGAVTRQAHWKMILTILLAWITTLPVAAVLGMLFFAVLKNWVA